MRLVSRSVDGGDDDDDGLCALALRPRATGYRAGRAPDGGFRAESIKTRGACCQAKPGNARDAGFRAAPGKARDDAFEPKPAKRATRAFKQSPAKRATWTFRPKPASLLDGGIRSGPRPRGRRHGPALPDPPTRDPPTSPATCARDRDPRPFPDARARPRSASNARWGSSATRIACVFILPI